MEALGEDVDNLIGSVDVLNIKLTGNNLLPNKMDINFNMLGALVMN